MWISPLRHPQIIETSEEAKPLNTHRLCWKLAAVQWSRKCIRGMAAVVGVEALAVARLHARSGLRRKTRHSAWEAVTCFQFVGQSAAYIQAATLRIPRETSSTNMLDLQRILKSSQLPTVPTVALRLLELTRDPEVEVSEIVDTVKSDPAIAAKILKATNSSFFGFKSEITSLARAVPLLGTTVVTSLAMT